MIIIQQKNEIIFWTENKLSLDKILGLYLIMKIIIKI